MTYVVSGIGIVAGLDELAEAYRKHGVAHVVSNAKSLGFEEDEVKSVLGAMGLYRPDWKTA